MLKILGKRSSINVRKVLWTCDEVGLTYQQEDYGSGFQPIDTAEFRALNPNALVPVLLDDDFVLWESNSICRYLTRKAGREDLLPVTPQGAADIERWMDWQATEFNNAWRYAFMGLVRKDPRFQDPAAMKESIATLDPLRADRGVTAATHRRMDRRPSVYAGGHRPGSVGASLENDAFCPSGAAGG